MYSINRESLKGLFKNRSHLSEQDFAALIDSILNHKDDKFYGIWRPGRSYNYGDIVIYDHELWQVITQEGVCSDQPPHTPSGETPGETVSWMAFIPKFYGVWQKGRSYKYGDIIIHKRKFWQMESKSSSPPNEPPGKGWKVFAEIDQIKEELENKIKGLDTDAQKARATLKEELESKIKELDTDTQKARATLKEELESKIKELDTDTQKARATLKEELENKIKGLDTDTQKARAALKEELENKIKELDTDTQKARATLKEELESKIKELDTDTQKARATLKEELENKIKELDTDTQKARAVLKEELENKVKELDTDTQKARAALKEDLENQIANLKEQSIQERSQLKITLENQLKQLENRIAILAIGLIIGWLIALLGYWV